MKKIIPVILSGGLGTRLYPISTALNPKQFNATIHTPCLASKVNELLIDDIFTKPIVVGSVTHKNLIQKNITQHDCIILEPEQKNTAPAILLATFYAMQNYGKDAIILALPSDHLISNKEAFLEAAKIAHSSINQENGVILFGVKPSSASTQYGYIETMQGRDGLAMKSFTEKPLQEVAEKFFASNSYFWNSGIFMLSAKQYGDLCLKHTPHLHSLTKQAFTEATRHENIVLISDTFKHIEGISIDYAIMEKLKNIPVVELKSPWADLGSFESMYAIKSQQKGEVVQRPWGKYEVLEVGDGYKLKKIIVEPNQSLSMQSHERRSEHWTIINGQATVVQESGSALLTKGKSVFILPQSKHKLANNGKVPLEVFEIQLGEYLEEDDIVRHD